MDRHDIIFHDLDIYDVIDIKDYDSRLIGVTTMDLDFIKGATMNMRDGTVKSVDLLNVIIRNATIKDVIKSGSKIFGTLSGDIYACTDNVGDIYAAAPAAATSKSYLDFLKSILHFGLFLLMLYLLWQFINGGLAFPDSHKIHEESDAIRTDTVYVKEVDTLTIREVDTIFTTRREVIYDDSTYVLNSGFVNISLFWGTYDDLDLHVITPDRQWIHYGNTQGRLDVDQNAGEDGTTRPVENYYHDERESGEYKVYVCYFRQAKREARVDYTVTIKNLERVSTFKGKLIKSGRLVEPRENYLSSVHCDFIHSFQYKNPG